MKRITSIAFLILMTSAAYAERDCINNPDLRGCKINSGITGAVGHAAQNDDSPGSPGSSGDPGTPGGSTKHNNNGFGNGDQDAPGNSGPHNNAENSSHSAPGNSSH